MRQVNFFLPLVLMLSLGELCFGQAVSPRRETQVLEDAMVDEGDVADIDFEDDTESMHFELEDRPTLFVERRSRIGHGIILGLGSVRPWEKLSIAWHQEWDPLHQIGIFAGGGNGKRDGDLDQRSFKMAIESRSAGVLFRRWVESVDGLRFEADVAYLTWRGSVTPQGQVEDGTGVEEPLSSAFTANGLMFCGSVQWAWLFANGLSLDLTILGIQKSFLWKLDHSGSSGYYHRALRIGLTSGELFGFPNLGIGYRF